jgi:RNA polymerase sigma factor (sigma-70 family)
MKSDEQLVTVVMQGDKQAFATLFQRHERSVLAVALAVVGDYHLAQDVVQEAFGTAYVKLASLRSPGSFGAWVRKIARHTAVSVVREQRPSLVCQTMEACVDRPEESAPDEAQQALLRAVLRLPQHEQVVLTLYYFEGHPVQVISDLTGRPTGTVTMQLSRARARLRGWLKEINHD